MTLVTLLCRVHVACSKHVMFKSLATLACFCLCRLLNSPVVSLVTVVMLTCVVVLVSVAGILVLVIVASVELCVIVNVGVGCGVVDSEISCIIVFTLVGPYA